MQSEFHRECQVTLPKLTWLQTRAPQLFYFIVYFKINFPKSLDATVFEARFREASRAGTEDRPLPPAPPSSAWRVGGRAGGRRPAQPGLSVTFSQPRRTGFSPDALSCSPMGVVRAQRTPAISPAPAV